MSTFQDFINGLRNAVGGRSDNSQVTASRQASRIRGTQENYLMLQTNLLRTAVRNLGQMNGLLSAMNRQMKMAVPVGADSRATPVGVNGWQRIKDSLARPLKSIQSTLADIKQKQLKPLLDKGLRLRDKGKDLVESMRKFLSPAEWTRKLQSAMAKPFAPLMKLLSRRSSGGATAQTPALTTSSPVLEDKKQSGIMDRMSRFMSDIRQTFEELPGVGAATSLMVMKVTKEQTKELAKIRQILEKVYNLEEAAEVRAEKAESQKEEDDFEKKAGQARNLPTFEHTKKPKAGGNWFFGLVQDAVAGLFSLSGMKGILGKLGKVGEWIAEIGTAFKKIPGLGKIFEIFKGGEGAVGIFSKLGSIGEWIMSLGGILTKIPGIAKLGRLAGGTLGKLLWPITALIAIFDFFTGWKDAGKILGKAEDALTLTDKLSAGFGSVLGGIVGVLDTLLGFFGIKTDMGGFTKKWTAKLLATVSDFMYDSIVKPLQLLGDSVAKMLGFRSLQSAIDFVKFKLEKGAKFIQDAFGSLMKNIGDFFTSTGEWATDLIKSLGASITDGLGAIGDTVAQYLGFDSMKSAYQSLKDKITGVFSGIGAGVAKLLGFENFDSLIDQVLNLKDQIMKPFVYITEKIGGFVKGLGKVAGYFGYNDKEFADYEKKLNADRAAKTDTRAQQAQQAKQAAQKAQSPNAPIQMPSTPGNTAQVPTLGGSVYDPTLDTNRPFRLPSPAQTTPPPTPEGQGAEWVRPIMSGVTSSFGTRIDPVTGMGTKMHEGTDYAGKMGDPVKAAGDGVVQLATSLKGYGNVVYLNHANGYQTRYGHLSAFAPLSIGQQVKAGQVIGAVGNTGIGTGPHLHFEVRKGWSLANKDTKPENPELFFRSLDQSKDQAGTGATPSAVPIERPRGPVMSRMPDVGTAVGTGLGQINESAMTNAPGSVRPVMSPDSLRTPGIGDEAGTGGPKYKAGTVPPEIADIAVKMEKESGVPAAVTIAQWATESGWGTKAIGNNAFGITKARRHTKSQTKSTTEDITYDQFKKFSPEEQKSVRNMDGSPITEPWQGKQRVKMDRQFADFDTLEDAFRDHNRLLSSKNGPYKTAFDRYKMTGDVNGFIQDIAPTYASDRKYGNVVGGIANQKNVLTAINTARNGLGVEARQPITVAQAPTTGRDISRNTASIAAMERSMMQSQSGGDVTVAPVNVNQTSTSIVADLKARNAENTHKRLMDREYYRT